MRTVAFHTLGCKVNQYETEAMTELFASAGFGVVPFEEVADVYVINTCTVTATSDRKSRQMIHRARTLNPDAVIAVAGCYSQVSPDEVRSAGADIVIGNTDKSRIVSLVSDMDKGSVKDILKEHSFEDMAISSFGDKTRAFVKIEDGCNSFCSYCIIPYARGPVRSRPIESIITEVSRLAEAGFTEVVLTGIHITSYGMDIKDKSITLADVIEAVHNICGIRRIRLGSLEPRVMTEDFIKRIATLPKLCNHFHLSVQSGCDDTLKRMNRKYDTAMFKEAVSTIRRYVPDSAITTDIMVGFPGETEEEFETSLKFMEDICFAESHVFAYSNRPGTRADKAEGQVKKSDKTYRASLMADKAGECREKFLSSFVGRTLTVLFEKNVEDDLYEGHTANYITVRTPSDTDITNKYIDITIDSITDGIASGTIYTPKGDV